MNTWLKLLPLEIQEVNQMIEPTQEVQDGEVIVGVISEELRKLYSLWKSLERAAELLAVEQRYAKITDQDRGKFAEMISKAKTLQMIFWVSAIDELQLWGHPEKCSLRVGWQVVEFKASPQVFPFDLFGGFNK